MMSGVRFPSRAAVPPEGSSSAFWRRAALLHSLRPRRAGRRRGRPLTVLFLLLLMLCHPLRRLRRDARWRHGWRRVDWVLASGGGDLEAVFGFEVVTDLRAVDRAVGRPV